MYEQHFGFREPPFRITPDPRFLYRTPCVDEAAAALAYGIERRKGFLSLVGEAGTGKTTLLRHVLDTLSGNVRTVLLLHPTVAFDEILEYVLTELGIPTDGGRKLVLLQRLHEFLLEHTRAGGNVALLIDEAQDLDRAVLEELRLLSNLETGTEKILQIVLAGQPELEATLADPGLRQLRQRIALHVRLRPLSADEVAAYVATRLELAGSTRRDVFTPEALARIAFVTQGIPRVVNVLCDACLLTAYATGSEQVTPAIVEEAWADYGRLVGPPVHEAAPAPGALPVAPSTPVPTPLTATPPAVAPAPVAEPLPSRPAAAPRPDPMLGAPAQAPDRRSDREPVRSAPRAAREPAERPGAVVPPGPQAELPWGVSVRTAGLAIGLLLVVLAAVHTARWRAGTAPLPRPAAPVPTVADARGLVHRYLLAYEARDADRLAALYAADAVDGEWVGVERIRAEYARMFQQLADAAYDVPVVETVARERDVRVAGPFVIVSRDPAGERTRRTGTAEWVIAHRDGATRIVALRYGPPSAA